MAEPTSSPNQPVKSHAVLSSGQTGPAAETQQDSYSRFAETYQSLNRVIHSLQREFFELKEEFDRRTGELVELNRKLLAISGSQAAFGDTLTSIFQSVGLGIIVVDSAGLVTHLNETAGRILGVSATQTIGTAYRQLGNVDTRAAEPGTADLQDSTPKMRQSLRAERTITRPDGSSAIVSSAVTLLRSRDGEALGVVEAIQELTDLRRMEAELSRLKTLAAMGEMVAGIAHEVRNPLAAIGGFAALLERDLAADEKKRALAGKIMQGVESLNATVTSLLDYTRQIEPQLQRVEIRSFLQQAIDAFLAEEGSADWRIDIRLEPTECGGNEPVSYVDVRLMRQVMINLLRNAVEAMAGHGKVVVHYECLSRAAASRYSEQVILSADERLLLISVTDTGPGIPAEIRERLFFPLATTKPQGTGLGLAMASKFVQSHGGDICAEANSPSGAVFRILLPLRRYSADSAGGHPQEVKE